MLSIGVDRFRHALRLRPSRGQTHPCCDGGLEKRSPAMRHAPILSAVAPAILSPVVVFGCLTARADLRDTCNRAARLRKSAAGVRTPRSRAVLPEPPSPRSCAIARADYPP